MKKLKNTDQVVDELFKKKNNKMPKVLAKVIDYAKDNGYSLTKTVVGVSNDHLVLNIPWPVELKKQLKRLSKNESNKLRREFNNKYNKLKQSTGLDKVLTAVGARK
jgi:hypothetical protein